MDMKPLFLSIKEDKRLTGAADAVKRACMAGTRAAAGSGRCRRLASRATDAGALRLRAT